jgi:hypothetical protein
MMHRALAALALLIVLAGAPPGAGAGESPADSVGSGSSPDSLRFRLDLRSPAFTLTAPRPELEVTLASPAWLLPEPQTVQLSPFASTLHNADRGAYLGLAVGYLGDLFGLWSKETALYMVGAGAVLGAGWGATQGPVTIQVQPDFDDRR